MSDSSQDLPRSLEQQRAFEIVSAVISRRRAGEVVNDADVLRAHPNLIGPLSDLLERASAVSDVVEIVTETPWADLLDRIDDDSLFDDLKSSGAKDLPRGRTEQKDENRQVIDANRITFYEDASSSGGAVDDSSGSWSATPSIDGPSVLGPRQTVALYDQPNQDVPVIFRPKKRPPVALLRVLDDDQRDSEAYRLRDDLTVIGRTQGQVKIPHDLQISARHAGVSREKQNGSYQWILRDLESRNGVFVRTEKVRLMHQDLLLIANRLVRFTEIDQSKSCQLQEIHDGELTGTQILEPGREYWIGRNREQCIDLLSGAQQLNAQHARIVCDELGGWRIENNKSVNGVWIRIREIRLIHRATFQLGEQRFVFELT
ncbi:FHA domain-containing protein [Pirellulales bacterium]|nr:FHA domain-containing protein [Pirellulales bacterium]